MVNVFFLGSWKRPEYRYYVEHYFLGELVYLNALGNGILVLNSMSAVNDLLIEPANSYSDRPE